MFQIMFGASQVVVLAVACLIALAEFQAPVSAKRVNPGSSRNVNINNNRNSNDNELINYIFQLLSSGIISGGDDDGGDDDCSGDDDDDDFCRLQPILALTGLSSRKLKPLSIKVSPSPIVAKSLESPKIQKSQQSERIESQPEDVPANNEEMEEDQE